MSAVMGRSEYRRILQKVGLLWSAIGLIDGLYLAYTVAVGASLSLGWNVFAIAAGILLWNGQLRVASWMRITTPFLLVGVLGSLLTTGLFRPIGLWQAHLRLYPIHSLYWLMINVGLSVALNWTYHQLRHPVILQANAEAGIKTRFPKKAFGFFIALVILLMSLTAFTLYGPDAVEAKRLAQQQLGDRYAYHVSSLRWSGQQVSAQIVAYSTVEIRHITVNWDKPNEP